MRDIDFIITRDVQQISAWASEGGAQRLSATDIRQWASSYAAAVLVPVCGEAIQKHGTRGFEPDGFTLQAASFRFQALQDLHVATVIGFIPDFFGSSVDVRVTCEEFLVVKRCSAGALFTCELPLQIESGTEHEFGISLSRVCRPSMVLPGSLDERDLGCIISSIAFR